MSTGQLDTFENCLDSITDAELSDAYLAIRVLTNLKPVIDSGLADHLDEVMNLITHEMYVRFSRITHEVEMGT